jgi:outer membrane protein assembly factor BamB
MARIGPVFENPWGNGPRSTPTVAGHVFALGAQGVLACHDAMTGKRVWAVDLRRDLDGRLMHGNVLDVDWGYSESPLVDGDLVVVSPGGEKGTVVALDRKTGKIRWRTTALKDSASYASAVVADIGGVRQYVQLTGGVEYSVGGSTGNAVWEEKGNVASGTIVCAGGLLYLVTTNGTIVLVEASPTGWSERGRFKLPKSSAVRIRNERVVVCTPPVVVNGMLYLRDQEHLYCYDVRATGK